MWNCLLHSSSERAFALLCTCPRGKWPKEGRVLWFMQCGSAYASSHEAYVWFALLIQEYLIGWVVVFYGISTFVGYSMLNLIYTYIH